MYFVPRARALIKGNIKNVLIFPELDEHSFLNLTESISYKLILHYTTEDCILSPTPLI